MLRRHKRLLVFTVLILVTAFWWGCSQPEDILYGKSTTLINLRAERLPTTPEGMTYQLWVADTIMSVGTGDSLFGSFAIDEPFTYDFDLNRFYDADGLARPDTNEFRMVGDILNYQWIFLSVERKDGFGLGPGPVMLIDTVTPAGVSELDMIVPLSDSLWFSAIEFNMETPSDGKTYEVLYDTFTHDTMLIDSTVIIIIDSIVFVDTIWFTDPETDGAAVWFSYYAERMWTVQDTFELLDVRIDTVEPGPDDEFPENEGPCIQNIISISNATVIDTFKIFGFDTIHWSIVQYDQLLQQECDSGQGYLFKTEVEIDFRTGPIRTGIYDDFQQIAVNLPDLRSMGWLYQGWVVSSVIENMGVGIGEMTPPAWVGLNQHDSTIRGTDGHLLSTGLFHSLEEPDQRNPHVDTASRVPPFPGEDFLKSFPGQGDVEVNLVPGGLVSPTGSVFITMHPVNAISDTTNFPLIIQLRDIPYQRAAVTRSFQQFVMTPTVGHNTFGMDVRIGLPQVQARVRRF